MQIPLFVLVLIVIILVCFSAFFSAAEIGVMSLNRYKLRHLVKQNHKQAIRVNKLLSHPERLLGVVLIGNTLGNIVASMAGTLIGQRLYGDTGVFIATTILTVVVLIFSEMAPKTLAALYPQQVAFMCSGLLKFLQILFSPLVAAISWCARGVLCLFGVSLNKVNKDTLSGEELRSVVYEVGGLIPSEHNQMLLSLLDLEQTKVEDIMIPKSEIVGIDLDNPWHQIMEQLETTQHTRITLYRQSINQLVGMVHLRQILHLILDKDLSLQNLLSVIEKPYYIPEGTSLSAQILHFRKMKRRSCFVVDEYGDLQGLVTLEDILEEIVGEFTTDMSQFSQEVLPQADGSFIIDGSITLRHLQRVLNWQFPVLGPRTLSGLIIEFLGSIPPADSCLWLGDYQIEILKVSGNMLRSVRIMKVQK